MTSHATFKIFVGGGTGAQGFRDNFTGFWNIWKHEIIQRDYALLDEIHPSRIKTVEEWLRREDQLGRALGQGALWERVQPENQAKRPPLFSSSAKIAARAGSKRLLASGASPR